MKNIDDLKSPKIDYVGGIQIEAKNPKALAEWYSNSFGLTIEMEYEGGYYGGFTGENVSLHIGIIPGKNLKGQSNISLTFHVDDFNCYLDNLKSKGLVPLQTMDDNEGKFAFFKDPENNKIGIWGT